MREEAKSELLSRTETSLADGTFVKMTFGKYRGGDDEFKGLTVTLVSLKEGNRLSFRFSYKTKDVVKNYEIREGLDMIRRITGNDFLTANLFTLTKDYSLDHSKKLVPILHERKPSSTESATMQHNKEKERYVDPQARYFNLLGITSPEGKIHADKYGKFRQVDRFIRTVDSLIGALPDSEAKSITATDLGSGKSYMTFALYDHLTNKRGMQATVTGIEQRKELAELSNSIAGKCGYQGLLFSAGVIPASGGGDLDIVTALHACDTATDDAIVYALNSNASLIMLAPCCQKYLRHRLKIPDDLKPMLRHPIHEERFSVMLTDSLRALLLGYFGYDTKVFEFVSDEHTARNTMITGVKKDMPEKARKQRLEEIISLKEKFKLDDFYLDKALGMFSE